MQNDEYEQLRSAYNPSVRCGECPDEDAFEVQAIEVGFQIPVLVTQEQSRRLTELIHEIVGSPWNQPAEGVHWLSGMGSKPHWSRVDSALLGIPVEPGAPDSGDPTFDDSVYFLETCAREFVSAEERERKKGQRKSK